MGGGILADEMGMGKSLTVIAHVASTLDRAHNWAHLANLRDEDSSNEAISSRSTLIVVPSMRESP